MKYLIKYFIDFAVLIFLYASVFFRRWRSQGRDVLFVNTLMYAYLSAVLFFTMMPVIVSIPFLLDHPYKPMNLVPFIDVSLRRGDFFSATVFSCFLMSLGIELLQPFFDRSADVTDLITNVIGGVLGYGFYAVFKPITFWVLERLKTR